MDRFIDFMLGVVLIIVMIGLVVAIATILGIIHLG